MSSVVREVLAWQALDSRGRPTVAVRLRTSSGATGRAIVPSGASTGRHEAHERRDGGDSYNGWGVRDAVAAVQDTLAPAVIGLQVGDQTAIDAAMEAVDGTPHLGEVGANAVLAVSLATLLAAAAGSGSELHEYLNDGSGALMLPRPMFNIVSGGAHAGHVVDVQDVLAVPLRAGSFAQALELGARVRAGTAAAFRDRDLPCALVADEGGLAGRFSSNRAVLEVVVEGVERAGLRPGVDIGLAVDVAATQLFEDGVYTLAGEGRTLDSAEMVAEVGAWVAEFPLVSVEDPLAEDDWEGWSLATRAWGERTQLLGDDLFVTDTNRLRRGVEAGVANSVLVKPNQAGTVTRTVRLLQAARRAGYATVLSARSGDTEDSWLADLAVGWRTGQIKVGSTTRSERTAKWNRLLEIESTSTYPTELFRP